MAFYAGCAGWNLRKEYDAGFPAKGTHLERYASRLSAVEINSCFYRSHRKSTYERWARSVPDDFRFAAKLPKQITHERRLRLADGGDLLKAFLEELAGLGDKRGPILVQLPPSLTFSESIATEFFQRFRTLDARTIVCEPRHPTWFTSAADALLREHRIGRVAADPSVVPQAASPGGDTSIAYFRWHGSPHMYYSDYDAAALRELNQKLADAAQEANEVWCIFDNTAEGAALGNALSIERLNAATSA